jgi:site-specific DNA-methyltransferase (adenine-specific)
MTANNENLLLAAEPSAHQWPVMAVGSGALLGVPQLLLGDCLEKMKEIPNGSVDMVMCDLPYGTTSCKWDSVIPFGPLWAHYRRVCNRNAAIVLTASQPFTSALVMSNIDWFKYCWVWTKNLPTGFAAAKYRPMTSHEDIAVFCQGTPTYNPQKTKSRIADRKLGGSNGIRAKAKDGGVYGTLETSQTEITLKHEVSPRTTLEIDCVPRATGTLHPTQKPVALMEYLIRTYTNEGQIVLDNTMGSGTTGVACVNTKRRFIGIERDEAYFAIAKKRIDDALASSHNHTL